MSNEKVVQALYLAACEIGFSESSPLEDLIIGVEGKTKRK